MYYKFIFLWVQKFKFVIIMFMNLANNRLENFGSGKISLFIAAFLLDMINL